MADIRGDREDDDTWGKPPPVYPGQPTPTLPIADGKQEQIKTPTPAELEVAAGKIRRVV